MKSMLKIIEKKTTNFVNISLLEIEAVKNLHVNIEATNFVNIRLLKFETAKIWRKKNTQRKKKLDFRG